MYQRLAPFMQLPEALPARGGAGYAAGGGRFGAGEGVGAFEKAARKPAHLQPFDLNLADTTQLMQIRRHRPGPRQGAW
ncbi:MAG: hypothetical protein WKG07_11220 [Hymenobacter sp.]